MNRANFLRQPNRNPNRGGFSNNNNQFRRNSFETNSIESFGRPNNFRTSFRDSPEDDSPELGLFGNTIFRSNNNNIARNTNNFNRVRVQDSPEDDSPEFNFFGTNIRRNNNNNILRNRNNNNNRNNFVFRDSPENDSPEDNFFRGNSRRTNNNNIGNNFRSNNLAFRDSPENDSPEDNFLETTIRRNNNNIIRNQNNNLNRNRLSFRDSPEDNSREFNFINTNVRNNNLNQNRFTFRNSIENDSPEDNFFGTTLRRPNNIQNNNVNFLRNTLSRGDSPEDNSNEFRAFNHNNNILRRPTTSVAIPTRNNNLANIGFRRDSPENDSPEDLFARNSFFRQPNNNNNLVPRNRLRQDSPEDDSDERPRHALPNHFRINNQVATGSSFRQQGNLRRDSFESNSIEINIPRGSIVPNVGFRSVSSNSGRTGSSLTTGQRPVTTTNV